MLGGGSGTAKSWELDQLKKALLLFTPGSYEAAVPAAHPPPSLEVLQKDAGFRVIVRDLGFTAMHARGCDRRLRLRAQSSRGQSVEFSTLMCCCTAAVPNQVHAETTFSSRASSEAAVKERKASQPYTLNPRS